jgi:hypothetical protein
MVKVGMITSSPGPRPSTARRRWSDVVPLEQATPWRQPMAAAKASSNSRTKRPAEEIQLDWMHWVRYRSSLPSSFGSETGMIRRVSSSSVTGIRGMRTSSWGSGPGMILASSASTDSGSRVSSIMTSASS